jgi:hypothetical protein
VPSTYDAAVGKATLPGRRVLDHRPIRIGLKSNCSTALAVVALSQDSGMTVLGMGALYYADDATVFL